MMEDEWIFIVSGCYAIVIVFIIAIICYILMKCKDRIKKKKKL